MMHPKPPKDELLGARNAETWVSMPVPPQQVDTAFRALEPRVGRTRRMVVGALAVAAALFLLRLLPFPGAEPEVRSPLVMASGSDPVSTVLSDGSVLSIGPESRVVETTGALGEMVYELERGRVECDVTPRADRRFIVWAGRVRVRVLGTRFTVDMIREGGAMVAVEVAVARGHVEVTPPDGEASHLAAGERLRIDLSRSDRAETAEVSETEISETSETEISETSEAEISGAPAATREHATRAVSDARSLFDEGRELEAEGEIEAAIARFELLLRNHPRDPRASVAAFEIGRLRMDRLGDTVGAARAFRRAMAMAPRSPLRDDALARLVRIADHPDAIDECRRLRIEYLEAFPVGRHRNDVSSRCP